jgi:hypothetical protein
VHPLRVHNQAKQAAQSGPPISIGFSMEQPFSNTGPRCKHLGPGRYVSVINDNH